MTFLLNMLMIIVTFTMLGFFLAMVIIKYKTLLERTQIWSEQSDLHRKKMRRILHFFLYIVSLILSGSSL